VNDEALARERRRRTLRDPGDDQPVVGYARERGDLERRRQRDSLRIEEIFGVDDSGLRPG
jgi:hypothetical protein